MLADVTFKLPLTFRTTPSKDRPLPEFLTHRSDRDGALFESVRGWSQDSNWRNLNCPRLKKITQSEGIDFATALLYQRILDSPDQGPTIAEIEKYIEAFEEIRRPSDVRVAIVPGGCHEENGDSRKSLELVYEEVKRLGCDPEIIPTPSFGTLSENALLIQSWLQSRQGKYSILVTLSKGSAEVKIALRDDPRLFEGIQAWINCSGLLYGSEFLSWLLKRRVSKISARLWCWFWKYKFQALQDLCRTPNGPLDFQLELPESLLALHLVGFPMRGKLSKSYTNRSYERVRENGPNDGMGMLLGDLQQYPGHIIPIWNTDHFLQLGHGDIRAVFGPVLDYVTSKIELTSKPTPLSMNTGSVGG